MYPMKPNHEMWQRMNLAALNGAPEVSAGELIVTMQAAIASILVNSGACSSEAQARAHMAAMLLSPDDGAVGEYYPLLIAELARLREEHQAAPVKRGDGTL